ncbi:uncharacterized protein Triagg1_2081 [Trichoderma aggressivum f. europaeum]|uniref:Uncharacterized protein n=1 Tax=Trichoderma aggressivum f. europaeum TaxID=173218 RepID=A0AAE1IJK8_9HYPO|nr:hypothetical protein Triagg1_2081 [Trichoderma aggressivum f. europaeum]
MGFIFAVRSLPDFTQQNLIKPTDLVRLYVDNYNQIKPLIDSIVTMLPVPVFLPITRNMISGRLNEENDQLDVAATVLAHAIQVLLFAPFTSTRGSFNTIDKEVTVTPKFAGYENYESTGSKSSKSVCYDEAGRIRDSARDYICYVTPPHLLS